MFYINWLCKNSMLTKRNVTLKEIYVMKKHENTIITFLTHFSHDKFNSYSQQYKKWWKWTLSFTTQTVIRFHFNTSRSSNNAVRPLVHLQHDWIIHDSILFTQTSLSSSSSTKMLLFRSAVCYTLMLMLCLSVCLSVCTEATREWWNVIIPVTQCKPLVSSHPIPYHPHNSSRTNQILDHPINIHTLTECHSLNT